MKIVSELQSGAPEVIAAAIEEDGACLVCLYKGAIVADWQSLRSAARHRDDPKHVAKAASEMGAWWAGLINNSFPANCLEEFSTALIAISEDFRGSLRNIRFSFGGTVPCEIQCRWPIVAWDPSSVLIGCDEYTFRIVPRWDGVGGHYIRPLGFGAIST